MPNNLANRQVTCGLETCQPSLAAGVSSRKKKSSKLFLNEMTNVAMLVSKNDGF